MFAGCGGNIDDNGGTFFSPGYPNQYAKRLTCEWYITVTPGLLVQLTFNTFNVEDCTGSSICPCDHVQVRDTAMVKQGGLYGK